MDTRNIGSITVSVIGLGCNNFGRRLDQEATNNVVDAAIAAGVTFFDTADIYGDTHSESFLGNVLQGRRDKVVLATKFGMASKGDSAVVGGARPEYVRSALEASLKRLRMDHVDLYQLHEPDEEVPLADTLGALAEAVSAGLVREIGCSNFTATQLAEAEALALQHDWPRFVSVQNEYSMLRRGPEAEVLDVCRRLDIAFLPYFPLFSGILTGKYRKGHDYPVGTRVTGSSRWEQYLTPTTLDLIEALVAFAAERGKELVDLAFAWLLAEPAVASVIAGATSAEQVQRNAQAGAWQLSAAERATVNDLLARHGFTA
ncbi:MAG TPA: aldo/keto reductase [Trueperaceae bacterium]|nr:aldo/keto reductase [Trueperaceae bacterium]